jgi:hypothetical protein
MPVLRVALIKNVVTQRFFKNLVHQGASQYYS